MSDKLLDHPDQLSRYNGRITIELWYPRCDGAAKEIEVGLCDVRAANSIVVDYDFDRDGYRIRMQRFPEPVISETCIDGVTHIETAEDLIEVAFVPAWACGAPDGP